MKLLDDLVVTAAKELQEKANRAWERCKPDLPFIEDLPMGVARAGFVCGYMARVNEELDAIAEAKAKADA